MDILIVEDEAIVALDLEAKLQEMNYNVVGVADSFDEAIALADHHKISLALLDINIIGEKTGIDIARVFREQFQIPCIFLTAFSNDLIINQAKEVGAYSYILKPYTKKDLFSAIEIAENRFKRDQKIAKRNEELEELVAERTKELVATNDRLESEMEYTLKLQQDVKNATDIERKRIAQELHDGISQKLTAAKFALGAIAKGVMMEDKWDTLFKDSVAMIEESMREIRTVSHQLTPTEITSSGLSEVLKSMFERLQRLNIIDVKFNSCSFCPNLSLSQETVVYRVFQELINNTIKHANATVIEVGCEVVDSNLVFSYQDNGRGFDLKKIKQKGIGIVNMRERTAGIGAKFSIKSEQNGGFFCQLSLKI